MSVGKHNITGYQPQSNFLEACRIICNMVEQNSWLMGNLKKLKTLQKCSRKHRATDNLYT